jgi:hypothetical protein
MGMTTWVGQGQSHLPPDVPGITTTSGQGGWNRRVDCASSRLTSSSSEARAGEDGENPPMDALLKAAWPRQDRQRAETSVTPAMLSLHQPMGKPLLHERIQGRQEAYAPNMLVQGGKALYKVACAQTEGQRTAGPTSRPQPRRSRQPGSWTPKL